MSVTYKMLQRSPGLSGLHLSTMDGPQSSYQGAFKHRYNEVRFTDA
jgi:hypothetical protein